MRLSKAEKAALIITLCFIALLAGYYLGFTGENSDFAISAENKYIRAENAGAGPAPDVSAGLPEAEGKTKLNINTAGADELRDLPGIGDVLAGRVIEYRSENGFFTFTDDIMNVKGIGEAKFAAIKDLITVSG